MDYVIGFSECQSSPNLEGRFPLNRNNRLVLLMATAFLLNCRESTTESDTALLEQTDVFVSGQDGVAEYRIPVLLTSTKGTLLAFCDARVERPGDPANNIDLVMKRSFDQGRTGSLYRCCWMSGMVPPLIPVAWSTGKLEPSGSSPSIAQWVLDPAMPSQACRVLRSCTGPSRVRMTERPGLSLSTLPL